jgi:hypothetical protein
MLNNQRWIGLCAVLLALASAACASPGAGGNPPTGSAPPPTSGQQSPAPTPEPTAPATPAPGQTPSGQVTSPAQAAAIVFASDPRWSRMMPLRPDMVGQSSWYEAYLDRDGFRVDITVGQGDCQAGCIEKHTWSYRVSGDGAVEAIGEAGDPIDLSPGRGTEGDVSVFVSLVAGPRCPVEQIPPVADCAPTPVEGSTVTVLRPDGTVQATGTTNADGQVTIDVPEGAYFVEASEVDGLMAAPESQAFSALAGDRVGLAMVYETGIR